MRINQHKQFRNRSGPTGRPKIYDFIVDIQFTCCVCVNSFYPSLHKIHIVVSMDLITFPLAASFSHWARSRSHSHSGGAFVIIPAHGICLHNYLYACFWPPNNRPHTRTQQPIHKKITNMRIVRTHVEIISSDWVGRACD